MGRVRQLAEITGFLATQGVKLALRQPNSSYEVYRSARGTPTGRGSLGRRSNRCFQGLTKVDVTLLAPLGEKPGNVWMNELVVLAGICRLLQPKQVFELGTFNGRTTVNLAANCPDDSVVHTLDIPHDHPIYAPVGGEERFRLLANAGALYKNSPYVGKVRQLWADSAEFDPTPLSGQIDLAFIDGSHVYEYVENDTRKVLPMMTPAQRHPLARLLSAVSRRGGLPGALFVEARSSRVDEPGGAAARRTPRAMRACAGC